MPTPISGDTVAKASEHDASAFDSKPTANVDASPLAIFKHPVEQPPYVPYKP